MTRALLTFVALVVLVVPSSGSTTVFHEAIPSWDDGPELTRGSTLLFFDDMEAGEGGWTHHDDSAVVKFHVDTYMAYSGSSWWCGELAYDSNGGYGNRWDERLVLPTLDLTGMTTPVLTFTYRHDSEAGYDFTYVEAEAGGTWYILPYNSWSGRSGGNGSWVDLGQTGIPLLAYAPNCSIRFRFVSDGAYSDADGMYASVGGAFMVDNIKVYDYPSGATIFYDDVETGGLCVPTPIAVAGDYWHIIDRACPAYSGTHSWWCGDDADTNLVPANLNNSLTSPAVDISGMTEGFFSVFTHFAIPTVDSDYLSAYFTVDGGANWILLGNYWGDFTICDGWSSLWKSGVDLTPHLPGTDFQMRFTMHTTDNGCGPAVGGGAGIMIDDLAVVSISPGSDTWTVPGDFSTIQAAVDRAVSGDVIVVGDGVYTEPVVIARPNMTLMAGSSPVIDLGKTSITDPSVGPCIRLASTAHGTVIDGLAITGGDNGIEINGVAGCIVRNCEIYGNYGDGSGDWDKGMGVYCSHDVATGIEISDNSIHHNSDIGIAMRGYGGAVLDNQVYDNGGGFHAIGIAINYADSTLVSGNNVYGHDGFGLHTYEVDGGDGNTYTYNTIHDNDISVMFMLDPVEPSTLSWNAFYNNTSGMLNNTTGPLTMDARYNWWGDASGPNAAMRGTGDPVSTGITYDPWIGKTGYEHITCSPNPLTLTGASPNGNISVDYAGGATAPIKGYSMKFTWDGSVATTAPTSVIEGDFTSSVFSFFNARTVGTNQIQVDCAIMDGPGLSAGGTLFEINFTGAVVDYSTCALTLSDLDFRDVNNDPITGLTVGNGEIIVDRVGPSISAVAITNQTLTHTNDYAKNTDACGVTAVAWDDAPGFSMASIRADVTGLGGYGAETPDGYNWGTHMAWWNYPSVTLSPSNGTVTVTVSATDSFGNVGTPVSDTIIADNTLPDKITGFAASPAHEEVTLVWDDPSGLDAHPYGVLVRYDAWGDYPFYATAAPVYPASKTGGDGTVLDVLAFPTGTTHAILPRDIHYYTAFVYDWALNYSLADASAQDRATNYWLGDVANVASSWTPDGLVTVADIDKLGGTYAVVSPTGDDATCNVGPTDDNSRVGIPLPNAGTGPVVNFEDLMIFSMNYGVVAPRIVPLLSGMSVGELALSIEEVGRTENGVELALFLSGNSGEVKGASAVLDLNGAQFASARLSDEMTSPAADVFFWSGEIDGKVLVDLAILGTDVTIGGSGELARITLTPTAGEYSVTFADATLRDAENVDLTAELEGIELVGEMPTVFCLVQNVPNPFNPITTVAYHVPHESDVSIRVYDVTGRVVRTLVDGATEPGRHSAVWDGRNEQGENCGSGVYFCVMETPEYRGSRKMMLLK